MKNQFWLWLILGLAFSLRIWQVGSLPVQLNRDEAALAYNSYLLSQTGQDEWGRQWPIALESFGDYKLPWYSIGLMPFFKIFGLSDWVVRLPSVLAGTVLVGLIYLLAKQFKLSEKRALTTALLVAVSPSLVFFSRMAFEANLALTYFTGALLVVLCLRSNQSWWHWPLLIILLLLSIFTYNTPLLLLPALMIFVGLTFDWQNKFKLIKVEGILLSVLAIGLVILAPVMMQKSGITIFTDETVWQQWTMYRASLAEPWQSTVGNRYVYDLWLMAKNFVNSFSLNFLVLKGGAHPWHSLPTTGHLAAATYVFGLIGLAWTAVKVWLSRKNLTKVKLELGLIFLVIASLAPAVITVDAPHATRSLLFFVLFHLLAVIGASWSINQLFNSMAKKQSAWFLFIFLILAEGILHAYQLFVLYPRQQTVFQPGFSQLIQQVELDHPDQPIAIVDPAGYLYIYTAWYLKMPAATYFATNIRQLPDQIGFRYGQQVSRYHFIAKPSDRAQNETILIQWSGETWQVEENL
jgi:4-amino-4-deoxy-L-arabinose transferase-like glycosyltransferase